MLTAEIIRDAVTRALAEDAPWGDTTSESMFGPSQMAAGAIVARASGVMAGELVIQEVFTSLNVDAAFENTIRDGMAFEGGDVLADVSTDVRSLLRGERIALNFVQRMCGIATLTKSYVDAVEGTKALIVDTRKTTPNLRAFEKYAVFCGGGTNHRFSLSDAVLVKDNHLAHLVNQGASVESVLQTVRRSVPFTTHIEVEVDRLDQIESVLASGVVDSVLIDNFSLADTVSAVALIAGRALVNASGGIGSPEQAGLVAQQGVDLISIGALTHSASVIDIGLDMKLG